MGLSESKTAFQQDGETANTPIEIGIAQMLDPRSPGHDLERTPVYFKNEMPTAHGEDTGVMIADPRSPSQKVQRTPITDHDIEEELRVRIHQLKLFDTPVSQGTESLSSSKQSKEIFNTKKNILKLLDEESPSNNSDSICLPSSPTGLLKKKRRSRVRRQNKGSQQTEKLQKTVVKKAFAQQTPRSPLAERNRDNESEKTKFSTKNSTKTGVVVYSKYKSLNESLTGESFTGKENEEFVWS